MIDVGTVLCGKYQLTHALGEGGMGRVFEAKHLHTGARLAVKLLHAELVGDLRARQRFLREARTAARVGHRNIVEVYDLDLDDSGSVPFIVQELLVGSTLAARLEALPDGRMDPHTALATLVPIMGALVGAHRHGVIHRDIKPSNIFLCAAPDGTETPKLIDFGVAKEVADTGMTALTAMGSAIGSPEYMSPEQVAGDTTVDAQTDVWAMGVVLYEALSGTMPFQGRSATEVMGRVLHAPIPAVTAHGVAVDADLAAVIHRCLERDRSKRFPSMQRLVEALLETSAWRRESTPPVDFSTTERDLVSPFAAADPYGTTLPREGVTPPSFDVRSARRAVPVWVWVLAATAVVALAALLGHAAGRAGR